MPSFTDLTGRRFGKLIILSRHSRAHRGPPAIDTTWLCRCDCGNEKIVSRGNLKNGSTNSCGCIRDTQGGLTRKHPLWKRWANIWERCTHPSSKDFKNYGARGITVCERWKNFANFLEDMESTFFKGATVGRIDNDGPYSPENCRWETPKQQGRNTRSNKIIDTPWGRMTVIEAAERAGFPYKLLLQRTHKWPSKNWFIPRQRNRS